MYLDIAGLLRLCISGLPANPGENGLLDEGICFSVHVGWLFSTFEMYFVGEMVMVKKEDVVV